MTESDGENRSTATPILAALAIVGIAAAGIVVAKLLRGDVQPDEGHIGRALVAQNDALQREDYVDFRSVTCVAQQGTENQVLAEQRQSTQAKGPRIVDDLTGLAVDGDQATATVVYHFEKSEDDKISVPMTFVKENGEWKVCSPGPR